jgi:hypothetical protein
MPCRCPICSARLLLSCPITNWPRELVVPAIHQHVGTQVSRAPTHMEAGAVAVSERWGCSRIGSDLRMKARKAAAPVGWTETVCKMPINGTTSSRLVVYNGFENVWRLLHLSCLGQPTQRHFSSKLRSTRVFLVIVVSF